MSEEALDLYATYGPNQSLSLYLSADDRVEFQIAGNSSPLFPPAEIGQYLGAAGGVSAELLALAQTAIAAERGPTVFRPDSATCIATLVRGASEVETAQLLYAPTPLWGPVQARLFDLVNGPWRALRKRTLSVTARWTAGVVAGDQLPALELTLTNAGTHPLTVNDPGDPAFWALRLRPEGATPEALGAFRVAFEGAEWRLIGPRVQTAFRRVMPGETLDYRIEFARALGAADYALSVEFRTRPLHPQAPEDRVAGAVRPTLGSVTLRG